MKTFTEFLEETQKCWPGYKKKGTQKLFGKSYNRCVKEDIVSFAKRQEKKGKGIGPKLTRTPKELIDLAKKLEKGMNEENVPIGKRIAIELIKRNKKSPKYNEYIRLLKNSIEKSKEPKEDFEYELEEGYKERPIKRMMQKAMDIVNNPDYEGSSEDVWRHNQIIKHTIKNKGGGKQRKKEQHNIDKYWDRLDRGDELEEDYELEESSSGERSGRRTRGKVTLARGRGADMTSKERSTAAIAKRAGIRGTGKFSTKDLRTPDKQYRTDDIDKNPYGDPGSTKQDTFIDTYSSPRKAAVQTGIITKKEYVPGQFKTKHVASKDSVRRARHFRKDITRAGANQRERVHNVEIMPRDTMIDKGDPRKQIERGKNFIKAIKDTSKHLEKAGVKKGEAVMGEPAATMYGEKKDVGARKRAKLYLKLFGKRTSKVSPHTKKMVGKV